MSEVIQLEMTFDEARETDRLIKRHINTTRYLLLDMRDRKGWKALGYESFKAYGEKELGYQEAHIYRLVEAAEVSLQIGYSPIGESAPPAESQLRPLKAVPEEVRQEIWEEATRKAEEEHARLTAQRVESAVREWKQRSEEWRDQWKDKRDLAEKALGDLAAIADEKGQLQLKVNALEQRIDAFNSEPKPEPVKVEVPPADYEALKAKAAQLETELATNKAEQNRIIQSAIKAKMSGYQGEVDALEAKKNNLEKQAKEYQDYLASLTGTAKQMESQDRAFEKTRQVLVDLASELSDFSPVNPQLNHKALALADMCEAATQSLRLVFAPARPELTVIQGTAA